MLAMDDRKRLNEIFESLQAVQLYRRHLDIFSDMPRKQVALKTCDLMGIELPPNDYRIDFDHQNKVVIVQSRDPD